MGDAVPCLMRPISHPLFSSRQSKQGDPLRALTASVTFGRFMNEPLDWERWSPFSHTRILEDVQKYIRPGSVAEKKAFFEAYYKNLTPKKGVKPHKKENKSPNFSVVDENKPNNKGIPSNDNAFLPSITSPGFSETRDVDDMDIISSTCQADEETALTEIVSLPRTNLDSSNSGVKPDISSSKDGNLHGTNLVYSEIKNTGDVIPSASLVEHVKPVSDIVSSQFADVKDDVQRNKGVERAIPSSEDAGLPSSTNFSENSIVDDMDTISSTCHADEEIVSLPSTNLDSSNSGVKPDIPSSKDGNLHGTNLVYSEIKNTDDVIPSASLVERQAC